MTIFGLIVGIVFICWSWSKLNSKGQSLKWLWFSLLIPVVPLIIAFCLKDKGKDKRGKRPENDGVEV